MSLLIKRLPDIEPTGACRIYIGKGFVTLVDPKVFKQIGHFRWFAKKSKSGWYAVRKHTIGGKTLYIRLHREITCCPYGLEVHHKNWNALDNRLCNLQIVTHAEHCRMRRYHSKAG